MGGIAVKPSSRKPFIPNSVHSTLTANGVSLLLKTAPHLLPDISVDEVKDKSKASSLTKLLACVQASWFCLSTITRFIEHLPVSMLELNAFAHALCTLAVYILWWHKPLDVSQPVVVSEEDLDPLLAYMWMASKTSRLPMKVGDSVNEYTVGKDPEFEAILLDGKPPRESETEAGASTDLLDLSTEQSPSNPLPVQVSTASSLPGTNFTSNPSSTRWIEIRTETYGEGEDARSTSHTEHRPPIFHLTALDTHRWRLAHYAFTKYNLPKPTKDLELITVKAISETMEYDSDNSQSEKQLGSMALLVLLGTGYGGMHALAWNAHFPTEREKLLWRVSSCIVASPIGVLSLAIVLMIIAQLAGVEGFDDSDKPQNQNQNQNTNTNKKLSSQEIDKQQQKLRPKSTTRKVFGELWRILKGVTVGLMSVAITFLYIPARGYLVYESVRTVFFLPPGAFETPTWTRYLIHVT